MSQTQQTRLVAIGSRQGEDQGRRPQEVRRCEDLRGGVAKTKGFWQIPKVWLEPRGSAFLFILFMFLWPFVLEEDTYGEQKEQHDSTRCGYWLMNWKFVGLWDVWWRYLRWNDVRTCWVRFVWKATGSNSDKQPLKDPGPIKCIFLSRYSTLDSFHLGVCWRSTDSRLQDYLETDLRALLHRSTLFWPGWPGAEFHS